TAVRNTDEPQMFRARLQVKGQRAGGTINLGVACDVFFLVPPVIQNGPDQLRRPTSTLPGGAGAVMVLDRGVDHAAKPHQDRRNSPDTARAEAATLTADRGRRARGGPAGGKAPRNP